MRSFSSSSTTSTERVRRSRKPASSSNTAAQRLRVERLERQPDRPGGARVAPGVLVGHHVDRDVPGLGVALEVVEHGVALHVRQLAAHDQRLGHELVDHRQAGVAAQREQALEATLVGRLHGAAGQLAVLAHHKRHAVAGIEIGPVVGERGRQRGGLGAARLGGHARGLDGRRRLGGRPHRRAWSPAAAA